MPIGGELSASACLCLEMLYGSTMAMEIVDGAIDGSTVLSGCALVAEAK